MMLYNYSSHVKNRTWIVLQFMQASISYRGKRHRRYTIRRLAERIEREENLSRTLNRNYFEECNLLTSRNSWKKLQSNVHAARRVQDFVLIKFIRKNVRKAEFHYFFAIFFNCISFLTTLLISVSLHFFLFEYYLY